ncbi:unnamed protein product, partial [Staurois parvus]
MALGRKGFTCGAIKGLTVCCVLVLHCKYTALHGCAVQELTEERTVLFTNSFSPPRRRCSA